MKNVKKQMKCIDNSTYEDCLTVGKIYEVELEPVGKEDTMYHLIDDNGDALQTMIHRFVEVTE
ncbi:hypothetical protein CVD28_01845 [Bacillus sp. M6-12]|uniref:hypothetical protein n=1 Tax=Bacillus sp. M6-12 TaxID=2054166 RepID=UPI000C76DE28|nr:hypothetical protein [Bacillus sp. M6-12]PLS19174.1 hypothetical protein CVD28_01845 [Bacillus sp. M6-12]